MSDALKILIVEDEFLFAYDMKTQLSRLGYSLCELVASGEKAIEVVKNENPDLVLMDMNLSGQMNGVDTAREINTIRQIPIIFMTGHADTDTMEQIRRLKPLNIVTKPITARTIHNLITAWQQAAF